MGLRGMEMDAALKERIRPARSGQDLAPATADVTTGLAQLAQHGVAIHEGFIAPEFADRIRERMEEQAYMERKLGIGLVGDESGLSGTPTCEAEGDIRHAKAGELDDPIYQVLSSLVNKGNVFRELMMSPVGHAYADGVFRGDPWVLWGMNGIITRKGSKEQFLHTDSSTVPQDMLTRPVQINCFVCITDFELEMGPTGFVPGSHLGDRPHYDGDEAAPRAIGVAKKGSAIIWDGSTWHGQCEHSSDKTRYAVAMTYCLYAIRGGENYPASVHDAVYEKLTEPERRVLGFESKMVGAMNVFGPRSADDRRHAIGYSPYFTPELHRD